MLSSEASSGSDFSFAVHQRSRNSITTFCTDPIVSLLRIFSSTGGLGGKEIAPDSHVGAGSTPNGKVTIVARAPNVSSSSRREAGGRLLPPSSLLYATP